MTADELVDAVFDAFKADYATLTITVREYGNRTWEIDFEGDVVAGSEFSVSAAWRAVASA